MAGVFQWNVFQSNVFNRWFGGRSGMAGTAVLHGVKGYAYIQGAGMVTGTAFLYGAVGSARLHGAAGSCNLFGIKGKAEI